MWQEGYGENEGRPSVWSRLGPSTGCMSQPEHQQSGFMSPPDQATPWKQSKNKRRKENKKLKKQKQLAKKQNRATMDQNQASFGGNQAYVGQNQANMQLNQTYSVANVCLPTTAKQVPKEKKVKETGSTLLMTKGIVSGWCGKNKTEMPEYKVSLCGDHPFPVHRCSMTIAGIAHTSQGKGPTERIARNRAALAFCKFLVAEGRMDKLPQYREEETDADLNHGGWGIRNSRLRLDQYCFCENVTPDYQIKTLGGKWGPYACNLKIYAKSIDRQFQAEGRGKNKTRATEIAATTVVRELYEENLIERCGEPYKHNCHDIELEDGRVDLKLLPGYDPDAKVSTQQATSYTDGHGPNANSVEGTKRKRHRADVVDVKVNGKKKKMIMKLYEANGR